MLDIHYSNITQKGKFGTIDSIKILSYRTNLTNITRQLYVLQPCPIKFPLERREGGREFSVVLPPLLLLPPLVVWMI